MMGVEKWLLLLIVAVCCLSCGPRREYIYLTEVPGAPSSAAPPVESKPTPQQPHPLASSTDRCERVCFRIGSLGGELVNQPWLQTCVRSCHEHASEGQLSCYERVERIEDLEACTVR